MACMHGQTSGHSTNSFQITPGYHSFGKERDTTHSGLRPLGTSWVALSKVSLVGVQPEPRARGARTVADGWGRRTNPGPT